ncbi:MAG: MerR family transcriptional regulator [Myxococcota bacterium]
MRIGELAKRTGLSRDTIRFYERNDIITGVTQACGTNRYKDYPEENLERLAMVACMKPLGFTLAECRAALDIGAKDKASRRELAQKKLDEVEERLSELSQARDRLRSLLEL